MSNEVLIQIVLWIMAVITVLLAWECIAEYRDAKRRRLLRHRPLQTWELYPGTTVWACKACGRCGSAERCSCGGSRAQLAESDARRRFMESHEPETGWYDDADLTRVWRKSFETDEDENWWTETDGLPSERDDRRVH